MTRATGIAAVVALFLLGLLTGVFSAHLYYSHSLERRGWRGGPPRSGDFIERLQRELDLEAGQRAQIEEIVRRSHREADALRREMEPRVRERVRTAHQEISAILNDEQRDRFEEMMGRMQRRAERFLLGPPGHPRRRPGPGEPRRRGEEPLPRESD